MPASPFHLAADGVRIAVRLTPKAGATRVEGLREAPGGGVELAVRVAAPPEDGKANDALLRLLAKSWRRPPSDFDLVLGATNRHKVVRLRGGPAELAALEQWLGDRQ